jgi:hypothetical protein
MYSFDRAFISFLLFTCVQLLLLKYLTITCCRMYACKTISFFARFLYGDQARLFVLVSVGRLQSVFFLLISFYPSVYTCLGI